MWLRTKARAAKAAWEKILLDELFLFSGGLEGAWSCADGWTDHVELPAEGRRWPREGITSEKKQGAAEGDDERAGVQLEDSQVSMRRRNFIHQFNASAQHTAVVNALRFLFGRNAACTCSS